MDERVETMPYFPSFPPANSSRDKGIYTIFPQPAGIKVNNATMVLAFQLGSSPITVGLQVGTNSGGTRTALTGIPVCSTSKLNHLSDKHSGSARSTMKQSTLSFAATKRTASSSNIGKPKASIPSAKPLRSLRKPARDSNEEESDKSDDVVLKESTEEEVVGEAIKDTRADLDEKPEGGLFVAEDIIRKTRSQIKKAASLPTTKTKVKYSNTDTASPRPFKTNNLKPEDLQKKVEANDVDQQLPELDPASKKWNKQYGAAKAKMSGLPAIHGENDNKVHEILRVFDNSYEYGPCVGMTRIERWERAEALSLSPPKEIYEILTTKQGLTLDEYKNSVFTGEV